MTQRHPQFLNHARRATQTSRRRVVNGVREQLHRCRSTSLLELGRSVNYSPFHLSRVFREVMGVTISTYRTQMRLHDVLSRLEAGADDLTQLALETGFSDHSHMTRTLVAYLDTTQSALRSQFRHAAE